MARSPRHMPQLLRGRFWKMLAGASFAMAAASWLVVNEQNRRARVAIVKAVLRSPPPVRRRFNSLWRWSGMQIDPWGTYRQRIVAEARGDVLEIGIGRWVNLPRYGEVERLVGVDPERRNIFAARRRARRFFPEAEVVRAPAEDLPFPDGSFDTVVTSLALCTVRDQGKALSELWRVLKPGGTLLFLEHVRAQRSFVAWWQDVLTPLWRLVALGCRPNRDTLAAIDAAGFVMTRLDQVDGAWGPARPTICGVAYRPATTLLVSRRLQS